MMAVFLDTPLTAKPVGPVVSDNRNGSTMPDGLNSAEREAIATLLAAGLITRVESLPSVSELVSESEWQLTA